ncbi:unnamed protein product [Cladocopium goreaui]|uniref:Uncharacterized protein n=1 Tax=Cladocopium goreaui TaxID=2562237 RepID=A0A9P1CNJ4_9DINO|nr:unnamed protein product [Cladocopium goreaui]
MSKDRGKDSSIQQCTSNMDILPPMLHRLYACGLKMPEINKVKEQCENTYARSSKAADDSCVEDDAWELRKMLRFIKRKANRQEDTDFHELLLIIAPHLEERIKEVMAKAKSQNISDEDRPCSPVSCNISSFACEEVKSQMLYRRVKILEELLQKKNALLLIQSKQSVKPGTPPSVADGPKLNPSGAPGPISPDDVDTQPMLETPVVPPEPSPPKAPSFEEPSVKRQKYQRGRGKSPTIELHPEVASGGSTPVPAQPIEPEVEIEKPKTEEVVTRRDQLASKAKKKEDEPRGGRGRGRGKSRGRGKGPGRGRGRGNRAEPATPEDECDDDEEMEGEDGEGCENGEKGEVDPVELGKVPKKLRPFVAPKPETSRAASSSKPRASRASSSRPKPSAKAKASSEPKTSRASSPKDKKEPKTSRASSSKAKKEPKTSRVSEDKGTVKACSEGDGGEPMESNKSKPKMKANKKRTISENGSSRPASRPRRSRSVPSRDGNLQKEIKEIQSFTEALDYHNLEFDDLKFYIKEAVTQQFEFKITQLNIYWKTARCGIRMYRADGKSTDPFSFTFPSDSGGHLLRLVVSVATAAHMVTSLYLHIENMFYVFVG